MLFRLQDWDKGAAPVGVTQCTLKPTPYDHPTNANIKFWDLPGIGTPDYPDLETYCEKVELEKYHTYLIFTENRFAQQDLELAKKVRSIDKKFLFIRTKIDDNTRSQSRNPSFDEEAMLTEIRRECLDSLGDLLTEEQDVFLISNHHREKWEFTRLTQAIIDALTRYQREAMTLCLGKAITRSSNEIFQRKVDVLRGRIWKVALASVVAVLIPVPGLPFDADSDVILNELSLYRTQLGLPGIQSSEFAKFHLVTKEKVLGVDLYTAAQLTRFLAPYAAEAARESALKSARESALESVREKITRYFPVVSLVITGGMSFGATYYALSNLLTNVEEAAKLVLKEAAEKTAAELEL